MRTKNIPPARAPPPRQEPKPAPGEEHIPVIIADAAIELETAPEVERKDRSRAADALIADVSRKGSGPLEPTAAKNLNRRAKIIEWQQAPARRSSPVIIQQFPG